MTRRRSTYGAYLATGLIASGGELESGECECCDEARETLKPWPGAEDTYRRVVMRHLMRAGQPKMPYGRRKWKAKR
jgi:hypothetical protein